MREKKNPRITRKDFIKRSSAGLLAAGLFTGFRSPGQSDGEEPQRARPVDDDGTDSRRLLGKTGIKVTPVGFGASRTMEPVLLQSALDRGINFLDTGRSYFNGQNETMVGKVVHDVREKVVIQSKISLRLRQTETDLAASGMTERITKMMQSSLDKSLAALKTDYVDVMLLHGASSVALLGHEAVIGFFEKIRKAGRIRACGFSSHTNQVALMKWVNKNPVYDVVMVPYNHKGSFVHSKSGHYSEWDQPALEKELKKAHAQGIGVVAMKTCSAGPYPVRDAAAADRPEPSFGAALKWVVDHDYVHSTAVAMGNMDEIDENVRAMP